MMYEFNESRISSANNAQKRTMYQNFMKLPVSYYFDPHFLTHLHA